MTYHLAGDSTVAPEKPGEHPMSGWGGELPALVDAPVRNLAFGGATTESFIAAGRSATLPGTRFWRRSSWPAWSP